jgi:hypothetical protein
MLKSGSFRVASVGRRGSAWYRDQCGARFRSTAITRVIYESDRDPQGYRYATLRGRGNLNGRRVLYALSLGDDKRGLNRGVDRFWLRAFDSQALLRRGLERFEVVGVIRSGIIVVRP